VDFSGYIKGSVVTSPRGDWGEMAAVSPTMGPSMTIKPGAEQIIYGWQCETAMARIRLDLWNFNAVGPVSIAFRVLSCSKCDTDTGIVVTGAAAKVLAVPTKVAARSFALGVWGGVPGPYWAFLATVSVGAIPVECAFAAWFDRLGDATEKLGPNVT
jgi:hypothetical protein